MTQRLLTSQWPAIPATLVMTSSELVVERAKKMESGLERNHFVKVIRVAIATYIYDTITVEPLIKDTPY